MTYIEWARVLGIILLIFNIGVFLHLSHFRKAILEVAKSPGLHIPLILCPLILGAFTVVMFHNWSDFAHGAVSFVGYLFLLMGVVRSWFVTSWASKLEKSGGDHFYIFSIVLALLGCLMLYIGFCNA